MPGPLTKAQFEELALSLYRPVLRQLQQLGHSFHDAEECYWTAVMELHQLLLKPQPPAIQSHFAWLVNAARNNGNDLVRGRNRQSDMPTEPIDQPGIERRISGDGPHIAGTGTAPSGPEESAMWRAAIDCIRARLSRYTARGRDEQKKVDTLSLHISGVSAQIIRDINEHASTNAASRFITDCYKELRRYLKPCLDGLPPDLLPAELR